MIASITGIVVTRGLENKRQAFFEKGEKIAEIIDPNDMIVEVMVKEKDIKKIKIGQKAKVKWATSSGWQDGQVVKMGEYSGKPMQLINDLILEDRRIKQKGIVVQIALTEKYELMKYGMNVKAKLYETMNLK